MANGYCPSFLLHMEALAGCNPAKKLGPKGFLQAVLSQMDDSVTASLNDRYTGGHTRSATVAYRTRPLASSVLDTLPDCETALTPAYNEFNLPSLLNRSISFWVPDSLLRQYCADVSQYVTINGNTTTMNKETAVMKEVYSMLVEYAGALTSSINTALVTQQATAFGTNTVTGVATSTALTFDLNTNGMQDAFVRLMSDLRENEICDTEGLSFVGNGPFSNLDLIRQWFANGPADNGINKAALMNSFPNVFFDKDTRTLWGANQIGVFEKGSLALINYPQYVGHFARRLANSEYFTMNMPIDEFCCPQQYLDRLQFDVQIKEMDCAPELAINGAAAAAQGPGVMVMLSWQGSLFTRPTTLYAVGDPLAGTNGTLRYTITAAS